MKNLYFTFVCCLLTGCAVYPTSYHGYSPNPVVVYPSHHSYWHGYRHHHHRHWH